MISPDRTPCINPRCRRTTRRDDDNEIVCGKCFRALPTAAREAHRRYWRNIRKWRRHIARIGDEARAVRIRRILDANVRLLNRHWETVIKPFFVAPEKPEGLDAFLEEIGL